MPVTAPISLTKIKDEFNGTNSFSAYVRGGSYVPNIAANNAISTTVNGLAMSQFLNATSIGVSLPEWNPGFGYDNNVGASYLCTTCEFSLATGVTELTIRTDGTMDARIFYGEGGCGGIYFLDQQFNHTWLQAGTASEIYVRLDGAGDTPTGASINTNLQLTSNYSWNLCADAAFGAANFKVFNGTISLRDASDNVLASKTISLSAYAASSD